MKASIKMVTLIEVNITTIQVDARVFFWEGATVNGEKDVDLYKTKGEGDPKIPCAVKIKDTPTPTLYSDHWRWKPTIDIDSGRITNWVVGTEAVVHYEVYNGFSCTLLDNNGKEILSYEDYVPPLYVSTRRRIRHPYHHEHRQGRIHQ